MSAVLQLVDQPDTTSLAAESNALVEQARALVITDDISYLAAAEFLKGVAALRDKIKAAFLDPKRKAHEAHKSICALEAEQLAPTEIAEREAKRLLAEYRQAQERRAAEERRRLEEEARRREEERRLEEAMDAQAAGDITAADEIISEPIAPPPVRVSPPTPKVAGVQFRENWKFEITDPIALVRHIANHPEDLCYINWNAAALQRDVTSRKSAFRRPGVRVYSEKTVAAGGRR